MKPLTLEDIRAHIKECAVKDIPCNWLGFIENKKLTSEVEALFKALTKRSHWHWVKGNEKLWALEKEVRAEIEGVKAIIFLRSLSHIEEPEERALKNWHRFTDWEKEQTMNAYKLFHNFKENNG